MLELAVGVDRRPIVRGGASRGRPHGVNGAHVVFVALGSVIQLHS